MVAHGMRPTNFENPPLHTQIHEHQNYFDTKVEEIVPETQQSNLTNNSNPTPESNTKGKGKTNFGTRTKKQPWTRVEEEALMRAFIDVSEDSVVGNAQHCGMFFFIIFIYVNVTSFCKRVESLFYNIMGKSKYRSHHQIHTKCGKLIKM